MVARKRTGRTGKQRSDGIFRRLARSANYRAQPAKATPPVTSAIVELGQRFGAFVVLGRVEEIAGWQRRIYPSGTYDAGHLGERDHEMFFDREFLRPEYLLGALMPLLRSPARQTVTLAYVVEGFNRAVERGEFEKQLRAAGWPLLEHRDHQRGREAGEESDR